MIWQKIKNKGTFILIERINKFREVVSKASFIVGNPANLCKLCSTDIFNSSCCFNTTPYFYSMENINTIQGYLQRYRLPWQPENP